MSTQATEHAFETQVETALGAGGWQPAPNAEWDVERALFPARVCTFLEETQPKRWTEMRTLHGGGLERLLIAALIKELDVKGTLHVLRHGFKFYGKGFRLATFRPAHGFERRSPRALRAELPHYHSSGAVPPGPVRHGGPAVRAERVTGSHLRAEESRHRPVLAPCGTPVPAGSGSARSALPL